MILKGLVVRVRSDTELQAHLVELLASSIRLRLNVGRRLRLGESSLGCDQANSTECYGASEKSPSCKVCMQGVHTYPFKQKTPLIRRQALRA